MRAAHALRPALAGIALAALAMAACSSTPDDDAAPQSTSPSTSESDATTTTAPQDETTSTTATSAATPGDDEPVELAAGDDLYAVPDPIPDVPHGTLLRYQAVEPSLFADGATWRILYSSRNYAGDPIIVSGLAVVPDAPAPDGGRPLLTVVHGTSGSADACAPSVQPSVRSELGLLGPSIAAGYAAVATDYEGMGTPGAHPYLVGESEGRSGLDAALALRSLPGADIGPDFGIMGYSQGGHAAMWTAQLAAEWAPVLQFVGTFFGEPPSEVGLVFQAHLTGGGASFVVLAVQGYEQEYGDELDPAGLLSPAGLAFLDLADTDCIGALFGDLTGFGADAYVADPDPAWAEHASANDAGTVAVDAPLLIIHSSTDDVVPPVLSEIATTRLCGLGQVVDRRTPDLGGHVAAVPPAYEQAQAWMADRFAADGPDPVSTC